MVILFNKSRDHQIQVVLTSGERIFLPALRQVKVKSLSDVSNIANIRKMLQIQEVADEKPIESEKTDYLYNSYSNADKKKAKRGGEE